MIGRTGLAAAPLLVLLLGCGRAVAAQYDVVVYGGTAGGVMAAIAAANLGVRVALLEPGRHVGGMISGGLGRTDMDRQEHVIGGYAREFFVRVGRRYGQPIAWTFEPHVAEEVLREWLEQAKVEILFSRRVVSVGKDGARIRSLRTEEGSEFAASVFIDSSYEGDLMKAAGVSYSIGRENRSKYNESYAGRQDFLPGAHQFKVPVSPYDGQGRPVLPYIVPQDKVAAIGQGDGKVQAFGFRLCLTSDPANRLPIEKPKNYDPSRFALLWAYVKALGSTATMRDFAGISKMPNNKTDLNAGGGVSTNLVGASWEYPEASYQRRKEIWDEHLTWAQGWLYFLQHDESVPESLAREAQQWGLPKDEFTDTGHWPHQLYVRETRRMLGEYVLTQDDLEHHRRKYDSIGMGGYNIDIREIQWVAHKVYRFPKAEDEVLMEGYLSVPVDPYEIPYRSLLPRAQEASNLLVSVCISASHIAFASFRMEPQYMIAGQSAGVAAALAVQSKRDLHVIDINGLQKRLRQQEQILTEVQRH